MSRSSITKLLKLIIDRFQLIGPSYTVYEVSNPSQAARAMYEVSTTTQAN
jgi:hypothetical protein